MLSFPHSLACNNLAGKTAYIKIREVQGSSFEVGAKVTYAGREMTVSMAPDSDGDIKMIDLSGFMALAASLPECGLTSLECAAAPKCSPFCQRPLTRPILSPSCPVSHSLEGNIIGAKGAFALAAVLRRRRSPSSSAPPPQSVRFLVSAR